MKCSCGFNNIGIESIPIEEVLEIEKDEEEELRCEFCGKDLIPQLKELKNNATN